MSGTTTTKEGKVSFCSPYLIRVYRLIRSEALLSRLRSWVVQMEGGPAYSLTIREILRRYYHVEIGLYCMWPHKLKPKVFHPGTTIGRYSCIADSVRTFT